MPNLPEGDPRHGSNGYTNLGCKCDICRAANVQNTKRGRERRRKTIDPNDPRHGDENFYFNYRCSCDLCKAAHAAAARERRAARG